MINLLKRAILAGIGIGVKAADRLQSPAIVENESPVSGRGHLRLRLVPYRTPDIMRDLLTFFVGFVIITLLLMVDNLGNSTSLTLYPYTTLLVLDRRMAFAEKAVC